MPVTPTYPGVYIQELPSNVHTITGVQTSVAAFIDCFKWGPMDSTGAVEIHSMADFNRTFGGLWSNSEASYAIQQFYLNGGTDAWVVRVSNSSKAAGNATASIKDASGNEIDLSAANPGAWAGDGTSKSGVRARVDQIGTIAGEFNLTVTLYYNDGTRDQIVRQEMFRNLSLDTTKANYAKTVVNDPNNGSTLVSISSTSGTAPALLSNGTVSAVISGSLSISSPAAFDLTIGTTSVKNVALKATGSQTPTAIAPFLQAAIRGAAPGNPAFAQARVYVTADGRLVAVAGPTSAGDKITIANGSSPATTTGDDLKLTSGAVQNGQEAPLSGGTDGDKPDATALIGDPTTKTGIFALENVPLFNLLMIPSTTNLGDTDASAVITAADGYCASRRAFYLLDLPAKVNSPQSALNWVGAHSSLLTNNSALYFPRVWIPDPLDSYRLRNVGPSGTMAGLYARIDAARGVWKAPAGVEATLTGVSRLDYQLTDPENGVLNPMAVNALRNLPVYGGVAWGARTLEGADQKASQWKYIPVRRFALYLEESLFRGTQWVVFEPNDEPLWAQIRLNIGAFMQDLFRKGAFQGQTPKEAYFVKCDKETTTQTDIDAGVVNIVVGFAPLKPAEFVVIQIQQISGQAPA
jgi:phage tail sheath protein FI